MEPQWRGGMYGTWAEDMRGADPLASSFVPYMAAAFLPAAARPGLLSIACFEDLAARKVTVTGKYASAAGAHAVPSFLRWLHRFGRQLRTGGRNGFVTMIGFTEHGLDTAEMEAHFAEFLGAERHQPEYSPQSRQNCKSR